MSMTEADARTILQVGPHAGPRDLRRAYRLRSKETHPDGSGSPEAFAEVKEAYTLLEALVRETASPWWLDEDDETTARVVAETPPPRRRQFEDLFLDAIRREQQS
jgi:hypothetical protein